MERVNDDLHLVTVSILYLSRVVKIVQVLPNVFVLRPNEIVYILLSTWHTVDTQMITFLF